MHLGGHAIVADHRPWVAQSNRLALDHEAPQRLACLRHKRRAAGASVMAGVAFCERSKRRFQGAPKSAEGRGLFLRDFVIERRHTSRGRA